MRRGYRALARRDPRARRVRSLAAAGKRGDECASGDRSLRLGCLTSHRTDYQGCIWYNVNSFFVRTTTSRHSASRACYAIILTVSDPILCNKSIYIIVKRNFLRDSAARYHLPPPARASSTDDPMTHLSRFSNGNATARFWQKVTTGLFKRRLHRVLDSKRRHILTYIDDIHHEDHFFPL